MLTKKYLAVVLTFAFLFLAASPEVFAHGRNKRFRNRAVAGRTYYNPAYVSPYYGARNNYAYGRGFSRFRESRFRESRRGLGSTGRALLTVGGPAAVGAGVGALLSGKKGAAVGALLGGGGGAIYYLLKNRRRR